MDKEELEKLGNDFFRFGVFFDNALRKIHEELFPEYAHYDWSVNSRNSFKEIKVEFYNTGYLKEDNDGIFFINTDIVIDKNIDEYINRIKKIKEKTKKEEMEHMEIREREEYKRLKEKYGKKYKSL